MLYIPNSWIPRTMRILPMQADVNEFALALTGGIEFHRETTSKTLMVLDWAKTTGGGRLERIAMLKDDPTPEEMDHILCTLGYLVVHMTSLEHPSRDGKENMLMGCVSSGDIEAMVGLYVKRAESREVSQLFRQFMGSMNSFWENEDSFWHDLYLIQLRERRESLSGPGRTPRAWFYQHFLRALLLERFLAKLPFEV